MQKSLKKVLGDASRKQSLPAEFALTFQVYYTHDRVLVTTRALVRSLEDVDAVVRLVPEAERRALAWFELRGIDCDEVVFTIQDGEVTNIPRIVRSTQPNPPLQPTSRAKPDRARRKR